MIAEYQHLQSDRLTWIVSGRYDDNSDFGDALSGRAAFAYQLSGQTLLRASVGTAYKTPTFTERFGFFPGQFIGNPNLDPETLTSYDFGIEQRLLDDALVLEASLYSQELTDEINGFVFDPVTFLATAENRTGTSDRSGIELAATWQATESLSFAAMYTYADADEEEHLRELVRNYTHEAGVRQLEWTLRTLFLRFVTLGSYWLVDANLQYRVSDSLVLFARGQNLLDETYEQVYGYRTLGRAGYAGLRLNFGGGE